MECEKRRWRGVGDEGRRTQEVWQRERSRQRRRRQEEVAQESATKEAKSGKWREARADSSPTACSLARNSLASHLAKRSWRRSMADAVTPRRRSVVADSNCGGVVSRGSHAEACDHVWGACAVRRVKREWSGRREC